MRRCKLSLSGVLLVSVWFSQCAWAQSENDPNRCSNGIVKQVGEHFHLSNFSYRSVENDFSGVIVTGVCKRWPTNNSRVIAAFAYDGEIESDNVGDEKQLLLALVDIQTNQIVASYKGFIPEGPEWMVSDHSLRIDTAPYTLSNTVMAFGLRRSTFRDHCGYTGGNDNILTLYIVDGKELRPVFGATMSHWHYGGGDRCGGEGAPQITASIFITVENTFSNGFADIRLWTKSNDKRKPPSVVVKYNGKEYDLAPWVKVFGPWWEATNPDAQP